MSYQQAFELTPFEKDIIGEFIEQELERETKMRSAMFGAKVR